MPKETFLDRFTSKIPAVSTFIIGIGILITYQIFRVNLLSTYKDSTFK
jgi:hypothetical protein